MLSFLPRDVLDEILDLTESVSEGFPTYYSVYNCRIMKRAPCLYIVFLPSFEKL